MKKFYPSDPHIPQDKPSPATVLLCTYPDSLGGNLASLLEVLDEEFQGLFSGVHILPFYPSAGDRGFAPLTHLTVAPEWGTWQDIARITKRYLVMSDLIAGHIATTSPEFRDFMTQGDRSPYADLFLTARKVWPEGEASLNSLSLFCHYAGQVPLVRVEFEDGTQELLFRSYLPEQADLDIQSAKTRDLLRSYIEALHQHGVSVLRLDAVETLVKDAELGFFSTERKLEVVNWLHREISERGMGALAEVFVGQQEARAYHELGLYTYGFGLVDHLFHALWAGRVDKLVPWLSETSAMEFSFISNHDGFVVGLNDLGLPPEETAATRRWLLENGGEFSKMGSGQCFKNINISAVNGTLFEVLGRDEDAWFFSQALVLMSPGIPIIYYNDLLQGRNDSDAMFSTGEGRALLRHNYTRQEIREALSKPGVQRLLALIRLRSTHSAFRGASVWQQISSISFSCCWRGDSGSVEAVFDIKKRTFELVVTGS